MRSRSWVSILAVLGVLLHAGAIVRHNAAMAAASLQYQALVAGLSQICHGAGTGSGTLDASELPYVPRPNDAQNGCPICSGLSPAVALAAPSAVVALVLPSASISFHPQSDIVQGSGHAVCPPARGPPTTA
jgi:hypothetical protein